MAGCFFIVILFSMAYSAFRQAKQAVKVSARAEGTPQRPRRGFPSRKARCVLLPEASAPWAPSGEGGRGCPARLALPTELLLGAGHPLPCWGVLKNPPPTLGCWAGSLQPRRRSAALRADVRRRRGSNARGGNASLALQRRTRAGPGGPQRGTGALPQPTPGI